jgi:hypothetical protein
LRSEPARSGYSSLNPRIADGSMPRRGLFSLIIGASALIFLRIIFEALLIRPFER